MAGKFDGTDDSIVVSGGNVGATNVVSGGCWVRADAGKLSEGSDRAIAGLWSLAYSWFLWYDTGNDCWAVIVGNDGGVLAKADNNASTPTEGVWTHIGFAFERNDKLRLYVDGSEVQGAAALDEAAGDPLTTPMIGDDPHDFRPGWAGEVADLWIALAEYSPTDMAEIAAVGRLPRHYFDSTLKLYLPLVGPTGTAINTAHYGCKDQTSNDNNVSAVNSAPTWAADPLPPQSWRNCAFGGQQGYAAAAGVTVTPSVAAITGSLPGGTGIGGAKVLPSVVSLLADLPSETIITGAVVGVDPATAAMTVLAVILRTGEVVPPLHLANLQRQSVHVVDLRRQQVRVGDLRRQGVHADLD